MYTDIYCRPQRRPSQRELSVSFFSENLVNLNYIICNVCRCRYSREAPFIALNVDIRNHHSLVDSLEQFVKGDLLEGANAYHCEKCDKKVPYCCIPACSLF